MTQISIASGKSKTIQATATISGAVNASGLIKITTSAVHGLETGDVVQIAGVTGTVEANSQWPVTVIDTTHFTLNNSTFANAYVSGGTAAHVGFATAATLVDNTVFAAIPANLTLIYRLEVAPANSKVRFVFEDSADSAFVTAMAGPTGSFQGQIAKSYDKRFDSRYQDFPDLRLGSSGDNMRVKTLFGNPTAGNVYQFSAWLEY